MDAADADPANRDQAADPLAPPRALHRLTIYLENGELWSTYSDQHLNTSTQRSGLTLPLNEWSDVTISFDLDTIVYEVNGQRSEPLPAPGPGLYIGTSVFGGHEAGDAYFGGDLRALRMVHRATLQG